MMIRIRSHIKAALLLTTMLAALGCSKFDAAADQTSSGPSVEAPASETQSSSKNSEWARSEFRKLETAGGAMGEAFQAIRETDPILYEKMVEAIAAEITRGSSFFEAGAAARPMYLASFTQKLKYASDDDTGEALDLTVRQIDFTRTTDARACVRLTRGDADPLFSQFPKDLADQEMRLMARVLRGSEESRSVADPEEVTAWASSFIERHPEHVEGLQFAQIPEPAGPQLIKICDAMREMMVDLQSKSSPEKARLFRGMQLMSEDKTPR